MRRPHARSRVNSTAVSESGKPDSRSSFKRKKSGKMEPIKLQIRPTKLFSRPGKNSRRSLSLILATTSAILILLLVGFYFVFGTGDSRRFGIIIDGGSTGTRIHVFRYRVEGRRLVVDFAGGAGITTMRVNPGLSSYAADPESAGDSLKELLEFARNNVPRKMWKQTEIRLMATAGLRLLDVEVQERILDECRRAIRDSGFKFKHHWASVITGSDEGLYAWVAANYALGSLGGHPDQTTGIVELGGASAQVTFVSDDPMPPEFSRTIKFGNTSYNIYSHSFLHFGQNAAFESVKELLIEGNFRSASKSLEEGTVIDPCTPSGYQHNTDLWKLSPSSLVDEKNHFTTLEAHGNFSECRSAALTFLQKGKEKCSYDQCFFGSVYMPKLRGTFLATENFFYTSKFFGLQSEACLSELLAAGKEFCDEDWPALRIKHHTLDEEDLHHYCFSSAYIVAFLHDSLGIDLEEERIRFANQVGNTPLDWAVGAFITQSTAALDAHHPDWIKIIITDDSPTLITLVAISMILIFLACSITKWKKTQLKTVFDLEKGRYIITRVPKKLSAVEDCVCLRYLHYRSCCSLQ